MARTNRIKQGPSADRRTGPPQAIGKVTHPVTRKKVPIFFRRETHEFTGEERAQGNRQTKTRFPRQKEIQSLITNIPKKHFHGVAKLLVATGIASRKSGIPWPTSGKLPQVVIVRKTDYKPEKVWWRPRPLARDGDFVYFWNKRLPFQPTYLGKDRRIKSGERIKW